MAKCSEDDYDSAVSVMVVILDLEKYAKSIGEAFGGAPDRLYDNFYPLYDSVLDFLGVPKEENHGSEYCRDGFMTILRDIKKPEDIENYFDEILDELEETGE